MRTIVLPVNPADPEAEVIAGAAAVLRGGGLVAFPTETVYGLGANALDPEAVGRIFTAKGRPATNPLIVHVVDVSEVGRVAASWPEAAARLAERFWPGPLTLVLPKRAEVPDVVTAGGPTVAVRVPAHPVAQALLRVAGVPVAAPSANRSTRLSPTRAGHVLAGLDGRIDMLLDGGATAGGLESTVLDVTAEPPRLLRPGLVGPDALAAVLGGAPRWVEAPAESGALRSPGMMAKHYAPRTALECVADNGRARVEALRREGLRVGWLMPEGAAPVEGQDVSAVVMPADPAAYASQLYAVLHALDAAGLDRIVVALPPDTDAWLAVRDRLRRASAR